LKLSQENAGNKPLNTQKRVGAVTEPEVPERGNWVGGGNPHAWGRGRGKGPEDSRGG